MAATVSTRRTQRERSAESNERLLTAATELIAEKGFERTSLAEISRRAGYSHSMASMRYGSKEAVLDELLDDLLETGWEADVDRPLGQTGREQILVRIDLIISQIEDAPARVRALSVLLFESAGPFPGLRPRIVDWMTRYEVATMRSLHAAQRDGSLEIGRRPEDAANAAKRFVANCVACLFRWVVEPDYDLLAELCGWRRGIASTGHLV